MKEIRRTIDKTYDEISQELARSKDQVLADLKKLLVEDVEKTPKQEKIELEREKEYITVSEQILAMKKDMQNMLSHFQYQKIYKERVALNKVMDAVKVVNEDLQNHINDSRPPVEEITWSLRNLVSKIKATTDLQRLKFNQYKELGIPNFHMFTPFQLFFKKFKKKLIENDKELSLLDAGVY